MLSRVKAMTPIGVKKLWRRLSSRSLRAYRRAIPREALLPGFVIIGVMKGGTSALFYYLGRHPQVRLALGKELHYFDLNFKRGIDWYQAEFPSKAPGLIGGEASPYYICHPLAARRMRETLPDARLIVLLRDPISRAYSHYQHMARAGLEPLSFEDALEREPERLAGEVEKMLNDPDYDSLSHRRYSYLSRGHYADQIAAWWSVFPRQQMLILSSEEFFARPQEAFDQTLTFLGLPPRPIQRSPQMNKGSYPPMNPATRDRLRDTFRPHNQRLYQLLGKDFGWDKS